jgi:hypothetical protein
MKTFVAKLATRCRRILIRVVTQRIVVIFWRGTPALTIIATGASETSNKIASSMTAERFIRQVHPPHLTCQGRSFRGGLCIHVLGLSIPERPILPVHFHQVDQQILGRRPGLAFDFAMIEEKAFLLRLTSKTQRNRTIMMLGPVDPEILPIID